MKVSSQQLRPNAITAEIVAIRATMFQLLKLLKDHHSLNLSFKCFPLYCKPLERANNHHQLSVSFVLKVDNLRPVVRQPSK